MRAYRVFIESDLTKGARRRLGAALILGLFFLIVPLIPLPNIHHVPWRISFDVGRMGWSNRLADLLHEPMRVAFVENIFVSNPTKDDGFIGRNFDSFDATALGAGANLISKFDPPVIWKFGQIGDLIGLAPSVAIFENFARRLSVVIDIELKPLALDKVIGARSRWPEIGFSSFIWRHWARRLTTAASGHVSSLNVFGAGKLFLGNIFSTHYQGAGRRIEKVGLRQRR